MTDQLSTPTHPPTDGEPTVEERRWLIVEAIERNRRMTVQALTSYFGLSEVSIRRDLDYLARNGLIQRVHGGAEAAARSASSGVFEARALRNVAVKAAIAGEAVKLLRPGDRVLLDSGTTALAVARALPPELKDGGDLTVMTRSLAIASLLREARGIRLLVLGGLYANAFDTFIGPQVQRLLEDVHVDRLIIGADGVHSEAGLTTDNLLETDLFRTMAKRSEQVIVVADSSKVGTNRLQTILTFAEIDVFVTDAGLPDDVRERLREHDVDVVVAGLEQT